MNLGRALIVRLLGIWILAASPLLAEESQQQDRPLVKIGVIAPLTGGLSPRGSDITRLVEILQPRLNASPLRYRYEFIVDNGKCGAGNAATTIVKKFIHVDKIGFLITGCSGETLQAGPIAQRAGVVTFAVLSTHPDVKHLGDYVFRTFVDVERGIRGFAAHMSRQTRGKVAILTEDNAFTFGIKKLLHKYLQDSVVFSDDFSEGTADFHTLLSKINSTGAAGIYFNVLSETTLTVLVNQARSLRLEQRFYSLNMPEAKTFIADTGANSDGMEFIGSPALKSQSEEYDALLAEFLHRHPEGPSYEFLLRTFYDATKSIVAGVEQVGPDSTMVRNFLRNYEAPGALGTVRYDQFGDIVDINYALKRIKNRRIEVVADLVRDADQLAGNS